MRPILLVFAVLLVASLQAQFQPETPVDPNGYTVREEIVAAGDLAAAQRVVRFVQVSDAHILDDDAPAPMRVEVFDQFGSPFEGAARPHEEYSDEVLNAAIARINAIHADDALDFVLNTGDNIDNQLENELMRFLDNWEGTLTTIGPVSGLVCVEDGQSSDVDDTENDSTNACTHLPASVANQNTPLAPGLPWYSAFGNHDGLIQGNVPIEPSFQELADEFGRRFLEQEEYVDMHFKFGKCVASAPGGDMDDDNGHGFGFAGNRLCDEDGDNDGYYAFEVRGVLFIVLDTVNDDFVTANENLQGLFSPQQTLGYDVIGGYAEGAIDPAQFAWMKQQLTNNPTKPVVLMAHHTINSMFSHQLEGNCSGGQCLDDLLEEAGYVTGPVLEAELATHENVLAFIGGHTHQHRIEAKGASGHGFWNVETSALIDHPQQPRVIEIWSAPDGKWMLKTDPVVHDFQLGAELAASDPQLAATAEGTPADQQVILWNQLAATVSAGAQPTLPHVLQLRPDGARAEVGAPFRFVVGAQDQLRGSPIQGLNVTVQIGYSAGSTFEYVVPAGTPMANENDAYEIAFTPSKLATHFATVSAHDASGTYEDVTQVFSIIVEGDAPPAKKSGAGMVLGFIVLVGAALRQNR